MSWVTEESDGTFTDIAIPNGWVPDADIDHTEFTPYQCMSHSAIAGIMHVHDEDLDMVAAERAKRREKVECQNCDYVYVAGKGWVLQ